MHRDFMELSECHNGAGHGKRRLFRHERSDMVICDFELDGNYSFDGVKNVEVHNARMLSKDAFWNSENVTVYDSILFQENTWDGMQRT